MLIKTMAVKSSNKNLQIIQPNLNTADNSSEKHISDFRTVYVETKRRHIVTESKPEHVILANICHLLIFLADISEHGRTSTGQT